MVGYLPAYSVLLIPVIVVLFVLFNSFRITREYERGVVFMLGRLWKVKGPGLILIIPFIQQMVRVDLRTRVLDVEPQDVISRDNVSVRVNAIVYYRVIDPEKAIVQVEFFSEATSQLAQTTLRSVLGHHDLDEMLSERTKLNSDIQTDSRRADLCLGRQGRQCRDQAGRYQRDHDPCHRQTGGSRTHQARQGDRCRG